jgi:hypothetical protein
MRWTYEAFSEISEQSLLDTLAYNPLVMVRYKEIHTLNSLHISTNYDLFVLMQTHPKKLRSTAAVELGNW